MTTINDVYSVIDSIVPNLHGWCSVEKAKRLADISTYHNVSVGVELGVFGGRSLVAIALGCLVRGVGRIDGIDPFTRAASLEGSNASENDEYWSTINYDDIARSAQDGIDRIGLSTIARLVRLPSREAVRSYEDGTVDLLHQDSNHSEEVSCEEVALWTPKMRPGGYWIFDDTDWPSTRRAQAMLVAIGFVEVETHETWKVYRCPCPA